VNCSVWVTTWVTLCGRGCVSIHTGVRTQFRSRLMNRTHALSTVSADITCRHIGDTQVSFTVSNGLNTETTSK